MQKNIILFADSYKYSQYNQYPPNTKYVVSYIESRGGIYDKTVFVGTQMFLREYLSKPITKKMIDRAERIIKKHGLPFYREGWDLILSDYNGYLPVEIRALDEGTVIGTKQVLLTITNTDHRFWWLVSFLETALLRAIWYPTTVASNSYFSKQLILQGLRLSGDESLIDFKLHDFGARGVSSWESAGIGGLAHLVNFKGTDTVTALEFAEEYYDVDLDEDMPAFSVAAMEHSTITSWTRDGEIDSYRNMIRLYGKPGAIVSIVSDSYDIFNAVKMFGTELKVEIEETGCTLVVRPDSGDPSVIVPRILRELDKYFGHTINDKGFKVLNTCRVLQGDGINHQSIKSIIFSVMLAGYSIDNIVFGQGGALLQINNRDDLKFAMKCCAIIDGYNNITRVYKDPITDPGKKSKSGELKLVLMRDENGDPIEGAYVTIDHDHPDFDILEDQLQLRFSNGVLYNETTLEEMRVRANNG